MHTSFLLAACPATSKPVRRSVALALLATLFVGATAFSQVVIRPLPGDGGVTLPVNPGGGGPNNPGGGVVNPGGGFPTFPGNPGTGTINPNEPRIVTDAGLLTGQRTQASVVVPAQTAAAATGQTGGATTTTTYQWTVGGGRITSDPTRQSITYTADAAGTVSLNVVVSTNGVSISTSTDVTVISPALAGTITAPATIATNAATLAATVPAAQNGDRTYRWSMAGNGAGIVSGQGTNAVTLRPGAPGLLEVVCDVTLQRLATVTLRSFVVVTGTGAPVALTVNHGTGGGSFPPGSRIDIFAEPPAAGQVFDRWTGDTAILGNGPLLPFLAHTVVTVPAAAVSLTATYKAAPSWTPTTITGFNPIAQSSPTGTTLQYHIPEGAQGLVFLFHDTGGSAGGWFTSPEPLTLARDLVAAGYGVAALSSVNRTTGAWSAQTTLATSPDAATLAAAIDRFARDAVVGASRPVFLLGQAGGADAAARYAQQLVTATPARSIKGVILYCASGSGALAVTSPVPQFFALAAHDDLLGTAGMADARANSQLLAGRGIASAFVSNAASPLPWGRFRALGLTSPTFTAADALAIWTALKAAGFLDANNYPKSAPGADLVRAALPAPYQARAADIAAQLAVAYAAQEFYSDANARVINFLNTRVANAPAPTPGRIINLSARATIAYLGDSPTLGFTLTGSQRATLLIRGIGPALAKFGLLSVVSAPRLEITQGTTLIASNEGWDKGGNPAQIAGAATAVGAFPLVAGDLDTALLVTLDPGSYTATIRGINGATGDVLAEVYDVSKNATRLTNLSTLARISNEGGLLIPGIVVAGANPRTLVLRAVGPGLADVGLAANAVLGDPRLLVFNAAGQTVATNNNWAQGDTATLTAAFPAVGAFALRATNGDAALVDAFAPGAYTLQAGATPLAIFPGTGIIATPLTSPSTTGAVLVEVYEVP